jgi:hypothetical protein
MPGESVKVVERCALTSDQHMFHVVGHAILETLQAAADASGHRVRVSHAHQLLAIIKPDETAELYLDSAACVMRVRLKTACDPGQAVFTSDLTDILAVEFPVIAFEPTDQVILFLREGFRFALYFDLTREFDVGEMGLAAGALTRHIGHYECYSALTNPVVFDAMNAAGWFPFVEIQGAEFSHLYTSLVEGGEFEKVEGFIVQAFDQARLETMLGRWLTLPAFKGREVLLRSGIDDFVARKPIGVIKTLSTEIEGILQETHVRAASASAKTQGLVDFAVSEASRKAGGPDTLFFAEAFKRYLMENVYQPFDPLAGNATAWRHGAAHGAAPADTYTMTRRCR